MTISIQQLRSPDALFARLARGLEADRLTCRRVSCTSTGSLAFVVENGTKRCTVEWQIGRGQAGGVELRGGALLASPCQTDLTPTLTALAMSLDELLPAELPPLLQRVQRTLQWGERFLDELAGDLLVAHETTYEGFTFEAADSSETSWRLQFRKADLVLDYFISPAQNVGGQQLVGKYGPFALSTMSENNLDLPPAQFLGYLLALRIAPDSALEYSEALRDVFDRKRAQVEENEPFLHAERSFSDCLEWIRALFSCKGRLAMLGNWDRECLMSYSYITQPLLRPEFSPHSIFSTAHFMRDIQLTDLSDTEVVMQDGERRQEELLRADLADDELDAVVVLSSCQAELVGDDIGRVIAAASGDAPGHRARIFPFRFEIEGDPTNFPVLWRRLVESFADPNVSPQSDCVNLIGYGYQDAAAVRELSGLLATVGVSVNQCLLPSFDMRGLPTWNRAGLSLLFPSVVARAGFRQARHVCKAPVFEAPAPYGFAGTRAWLRSVLGALGRDLSSVDEERAGPSSAAMVEIEALRSAAAEIRGAFICSDALIAVPDAGVRHGVPIIAALNDLGFGVDVLVYPAGEQREDSDEEILRQLGAAAIPEPSVHNRVLRLASRDEIEIELERGDFRLVYSEKSGDDRITAAGKVPISARDIEMGLEGARRTLRRFVHIARNEFFRRYARFLRRGNDSA